jgi:hypothetical protein
MPKGEMIAAKPCVGPHPVADQRIFSLAETIDSAISAQAVFPDKLGEL